MLKAKDREYFVSVVREAKRLGGKSLESFKNTMRWIGHYRGNACCCTLYKDFAPLSFEFVMNVTDVNDPAYERGHKFWFNGGVIAHGANSNGCGMPELSVTLDTKPFVNWQVHT